MLNNIFNGLFDSTNVDMISVPNFILCIIVALLLGCLIAYSYSYRGKYTSSFVITLLMLPAIVCMVIMMVNGNVGAGVAVAGAFSLVRFRSIPGTAKEIGAIFLAMASGLIAGMGYIAYAVLFTVMMCVVMILLNKMGIGTKKKENLEKTLKITVPEDLNYADMFDDLFSMYAKSCEIVSVKTSNMGSLYKLTYNIVLKDVKEEKNLIDEIRCRNGNLEVSLSKQEVITNEL